MTNDLYKVAPEATVKRLPAYWRLLKKYKLKDRSVVSCTHIAEALDLGAIQVRKDLACTGIVGKPKVGYQVNELIDAIETFLGWNNSHDAFLVGAGNLGKALMGYTGFSNYGLNIVAAFDSDPKVVDTEIYGKKVLDLDEMSDLAMRMHVQIGVVTVPAEQAQNVVDMLILGGIKAIWNFAPVKLDVHPDVIVENVELSASLAVLSNKLARRNEVTV